MPDPVVSEDNRTLWICSKDGRTLTCVVSGVPDHEELKVLVDREVYLSEVHRVHDGVLGRARTLQRGFEAHGWTVVFSSLARE